MIALLALLANTAAAAPLGLEGFLDQVSAQNRQLRAARQAAEGYEKASDEGTLLLAPTLDGDLHFVDDQKPTSNPLFLGDRTKYASYSLGLSKLFTTGTTARLSYTLATTDVRGASPVFLPQARFAEARPVLELTQSLWRNGFGATTRADQRRLEAQAEGARFSAAYAAKQALAAAETAYYRLALARESVRVERESLDRAGKMREWTSRRVRLQLADRADLLQSEAALQLRRLELQAALDDERAASRAFNAARELDSDEVTDELAAFDEAVVAKLELPKRAPAREDTLAARARDVVDEATAESMLQTLSPDILLYGNVGYNGRDVTDGTALSDSLSSKHPTWVAGLKFTAPLDLPTIFRSRDGQKLVRAAARDQYERAVFEEETQWKDLTRAFGEAKTRYGLSGAIESAQREKLVHEKDRFARGKTTAFQVLTFEQEYLVAALARIRSESEILRIHAQLKTFAATPAAGGAR
ncbi:MAG: TolC family protein [Deltaproteobacteria bacterium]|nr:TolC family protein [Deltaproteobacteria bacterium]